jgi:hypothetical protein
VKAFENEELTVFLGAKGKKLTGRWRKIHDEALLMFVLFGKYYIFSSSYNLP